MAFIVIKRLWTFLSLKSYSRVGWGENTMVVTADSSVWERIIQLVAFYLEEVTILLILDVGHFLKRASIGKRDWISSVSWMLFSGTRALGLHAQTPL